MSFSGTFQYIANCMRMMKFIVKLDKYMRSRIGSSVSCTVVKILAAVPPQFRKAVIKESWPVVLFMKVVTTWKSYT